MTVLLELSDQVPHVYYCVGVIVLVCICFVCFCISCRFFFFVFFFVFVFFLEGGGFYSSD